MNILVLAAGESTRFGQLPKQLLVIGQETILSRIQKQLHVRGYVGTLVTHKTELQDAWHPDPLLLPTGHRWIVETLLSTRWFWSQDDRTVILLGDTVYSSDSLERLLYCADSLMFLGHKTEIFGLSFGPEQNNPLASSLLEELQLAESGDIGKLRSLYWRWAGLPYGSTEVESRWLGWVQDWTQDVDTEGEYELLVGRVVYPGHLKEL